MSALTGLPEGWKFVVYGLLFFICLVLGACVLGVVFQFALMLR